MSNNHSEKWRPVLTHVPFPAKTSFVIITCKYKQLGNRAKRIRDLYTEWQVDILALIVLAWSSFNHRFSCFVKDIFILEFVAWKSIRVSTYICIRKIFGFDRDVIERSFFFEKNKITWWFRFGIIWNLLKIVLFKSALEFAVYRDACVLFENILDFRIF